MSARAPVLFAAVVVGIVLLTSGLYIVGETQQVIITRFGEPVGVAITDPGLHIKIPFIQRVNYFDKRFLEWDGAANQVPTRDKRFIWVDTYARWRIRDPRAYMERLRGDEATAQSRLDDILDGETRNSIARHDLVQVVRTTNRQPDSSLQDEEETGVLEEIVTGRTFITEEIIATAAPPPGRTRHRADRFPSKTDQLCRRSQTGRVRQDDRRAPADRAALPVGRRRRGSADSR